jgi:hypothetical protein
LTAPDATAAGPAAAESLRIAPPAAAEATKPAKATSELRRLNRLGSPSAPEL